MNNILYKLLKIMDEMLNFLSSLSFWEFIIIWTSVLAVVLFYLVLLFYIFQIKKDMHFLKLEIKTLDGLINQENHYRSFTMT